MRIGKILLGAFLTAGIAIGASAAHAANGTITFQNATGSTISTVVKFDCNDSTGVTCPENPVFISPGASIVQPVPSEVPGSKKYGLVNGYFYYIAETKSVLGGPAWCMFQVVLQSDRSARWSGKVNAYKAIDGFLPYTPACTVTNFTVNSTTGIWATTLRMR